MTDPVDTARRFNDCINAQDLDGLVALTTTRSWTPMAARSSVGIAAGKPGRFFAAFTDYRNIFDALGAEGPLVTIIGRSECTTRPTLCPPR